VYENRSAERDAVAYIRHLQVINQELFLTFRDISCSKFDLPQGIDGFQQLALHQFPLFGLFLFRRERDVSLGNIFGRGVRLELDFEFGDDRLRLHGLEMRAERKVVREGVEWFDPYMIQNLREIRPPSIESRELPAFDQGSNMCL
jgi:hypothetical protein